MRNFKTMLRLAVVAGALVAIMAPAASASSWTEEGEPLTPDPHWTQENQPLTGEGSASLSGAFNFSGGANCGTAGGTVDFQDGTSAQVSNFSVTASSCAVIGQLKSLGCSKINSVTANNLPWSAKYATSGGKRVIAVEGASLTYQAQGSGYCSGGIPITITGKLTATPDDSDSISSLTWSGNLSSGLGPVSVSGTEAVSPAGVYGMQEGHYVSLTGGMSFSGGFTCNNMNGTLRLDPSGTGEMVDMAWSGECGVIGTYSAMGCSGATVTPEGLPWAVQNEGTNIKIKSFAFTVNFKGCALSFALKGDITATPDKVLAISSTTLSGVMSGWQTMSGTLSWSPAQAYGLT